MLNRVAIVTDSAACIPAQMAREYDIRVIPFRLVWDGEVLADGVDLTAADFYRRLRESPRRPTSSLPSVDDFLAAYRELALSADAILSIHIPARLSGTCQAARLAADMSGVSIPIRVLDCGSASAGQALIVLALARGAQAGKTLSELLDLAAAIIPKTTLIAYLSDFSYLRRGGRVQALLGVVGATLNIVPVFTLQNGSIRLSMRARTRSLARRNLLQEMARRVGEGPLHAALLHADVPEEAEELRLAIAERFSPVELLVTEFTPVMGAHVGPGVLGAAFYTE